MNDIKPDRARLEGRERVLAQGLWDVWAALGNDTDGDTGPWAWISGSGVENFCRNVLNDAREYRAETEAEVDRQYHEAQTAEAEVARLTTLLEQRTAALTRTIDAKNTAEAKVARVEALHRPAKIDPKFKPYCQGCYDAGGEDGAPLWDDCPTRAALDGGQP